MRLVKLEQRTPIVDEAERQATIERVTRWFEELEEKAKDDLFWRDYLKHMLDFVNSLPRRNNLTTR
jgi:hypothetical protein